ncbi:uncharacterized protein LY89DRAFT_158126 [Mollisia scopiformis]|uniref:Uncharacterized protein n=1 Tax=Mollisia scopiformis TaxID=149040 RepID=A0A194WZN2_MOLSC|nr:uncharacterized protein LY89DRAFT_158126 [Mollisia scopiformis]KUJ13406.1 hypothetical protein LY89DRAFT_158126 [Mollisia scopiformis]
MMCSHISHYLAMPWHKNINFVRCIILPTTNRHVSAFVAGVILLMLCCTSIHSLSQTNTQPLPLGKNWFLQLCQVALSHHLNF